MPNNGIILPSRPLAIKLNVPNLVSNVNQTLSALANDLEETKRKVDGTAILASKSLATANKINANTGTPQALWSLDLTQGIHLHPSDNVSSISASFTYNTKDKNFGFVRIYVTGYNEGSTPVLVAQGSTTPITFNLEASGQTVTVTAQTVSNEGVAQPFADAVTAQLTLNGFSAALGGLPTGLGNLGWSSIATSTNTTVNYGNAGYSSMSGLPSNVNSTYIYARWTGFIVPTTTGEYTIGINFSGGANLFVCGQTVGPDAITANYSIASNLTYNNDATILLIAGEYYPVVIEWQQSTKSTYGIQLIWTLPSGTKHLIPTANLSSSASSVTGSLSGTWWNGTPGLWFPAGQGYIDPGNTTIFGPPTNGGGAYVVNSLTTVSNLITSPASPGDNQFTSPGWITGQAWSNAGIIDIFVSMPGVGSSSGYTFRLDYRNIYYHLIANTSNINSSVGTVIASASANSAAITGWLNFAIYISGTGYMALWVNNALACSVTDLTYASGTSRLWYGYEVSGGKLTPPPNAAGNGSSALNNQGSIATISDYTLSYTCTTTAIAWSWTSFYVYCPDGSSVPVAASTGSATTHSGASGTLSGTTPLEWTGLTANTTYNFTPYLTLNGSSATMSILCTGTSAPTLAQQIQIANGDGNVAVSASVNVTASTTTSGSGGGTGGGGNATCFSPSTKVKTQRGDVAIVDVQIGDKILTARGTWKSVSFVTTREWAGPMLDMGDGELSTLTHLVRQGAWKPMYKCFEFPQVTYKGTIHNLHIDCDVDDDGSALDTEHSYTLSNGLTVHNVHSTD